MINFDNRYKIDRQPNSLLLHGLELTRFLCQLNSPSKKNGVGHHSLLQGIFQTQWLNPGFLHCRQILYYLIHQGSPDRDEGHTQIQKNIFMYYLATASRIWASLVTQLVRNLLAIQKILVRFLGQEGIDYALQYSWTSLVAQMLKNPPAMRETKVQSLSWNDPLEEDMATHLVFLPGKSPWTEEPGATFLRFVKSWTWLSS